ncbi:hypothetical protein PR202_gb27906 [Eleusine coracana subsp. coracana]|uniref:Uncharacterized protein n=1 Tax=Eleusine coracana subsp. coracana TaxID=191504 RepID=A0AAV5FT84_ELECO|nr:hypothetical protein PR202_gb27906 [Eleusine coracana subsp. coracana]
MLECPKWVIKSTDKIRRGFLWKCYKDGQKGEYLVAWGHVCRSPDLGGLGVHDLEVCSWALQMQCL